MEIGKVYYYQGTIYLFLGYTDYITRGFFWYKSKFGEGHVYVDMTPGNTSLRKTTDNFKLGSLAMQVLYGQ